MIVEMDQADVVLCARHQVDKPLAEHQVCPYCFDRTPEVIGTGDHGRFCDYEQGRDPVCFGFPEGSSRILRG